jgi:adenosylmethionine-8-amino-7-oxononanoate aminotransferase
MFACEHEAVSPDFICLAKGLTGGYLPMAATVTTNEIYNAFRGDPSNPKTFYHGHTFTGNPLGSAVALAVLDTFENDHILENVNRQAKRISERFDRDLKGRRFIGEIRQRGLMIGVDLVQDRATRLEFQAHLKPSGKMCLTARRKGLLIRPLGHNVTFLPPLISTDQEIDDMLDIFIESYLEMENTIAAELIP